MSFWAFTKGATKTLREELTRQQVSEEERLEWERRLEFQMKLQEQVEKARKAREAVVSGIDLEKGEAYEVDRGGVETRTKLPDVAVQRAREQKTLEDAALARKAELDEAKLEQSRASAMSSRANAESSIAARARLEGRANSQNAVDAARKKYYEEGGARRGEGSKGIDGLVKDISAADEAAQRIALAIKHNSTLSEEEKRAELEKLLQRALQK